MNDINFLKHADARKTNILTKPDEKTLKSVKINYLSLTDI